MQAIEAAHRSRDWLRKWLQRYREQESYMSFYGNLSEYKDNIAAISDTGGRISYGEISEFADRLYDVINRRCLIFCLCENSIGSLCGYVAFLKKRIVPLLLDKNLDVDSLNNLINTYKPEYLWLPDSKSSGLAQSQHVFSEHGYRLIKNKSDKTYPLFRDVALLLSTSGSTGSRKLVRLSYKNIDSNAVAIAKYLEITQEERPISTLPLNYTYGLSIINSHLLTGATILLTPKTLMEKGFWEFFKEQNATSFGGVPYTYEILKKLRFFRMNLPSLKTMTQAGGKLPAELTREFAEYSQNTSIRFFVMYGQTEATARMSYLPYKYALAKCGSIGSAIPGGEFSLVDEKGNSITEAERIGELVYRGDNVSLGYAECGEDLIKGDERGGVLVTGDLAKRDTEGFYYITGRKNRLIKLYGNRVNLDECEHMLRTIISDCACAGADDNMLIFMTEYGKEEQVRRFIARKTGINPVVFNVKYVKEIPKNESGKTIYAALNGETK